MVVARFLSRMFPSLKRIGTERDEEGYDDLDETQMREQAEAIGFHTVWKRYFRTF